MYIKVLLAVLFLVTSTGYAAEKAKKKQKWSIDIDTVALTIHLTVGKEKRLLCENCALITIQYKAPKKQDEKK